jgi:hypothetical protein
MAYAFNSGPDEKEPDVVLSDPQDPQASVFRMSALMHRRAAPEPHMPYREGPFGYETVRQEPLTHKRKIMPIADMWMGMHGHEQKMSVCFDSGSKLNAACDWLMVL